MPPFGKDSMLRASRHPLTRYLLVATALLAVTTAGCQNYRAAVIPPPGSVLSQGDSYYNRPAAATAGAGAATTPIAPVQLSPGTLPGLPPPPTTSGASSNKPRDTYDVASRVAADSQPIRVVDSTKSPSNSLATAPRGMMLNDGTTARSWQPNTSGPAVASNPFTNLRGGSSTAGTLPQGFSGQDGQWRSRSSYEATERR